jgi:hypothetical protein
MCLGWNIGTTIMPCLNSNSPPLEHSQSITRCVAIITVNIFVLFCTAYYQTLLLSSRCGSQIRSFQFILSGYYSKVQNIRAFCLTRLSSSIMIVPTVQPFTSEELMKILENNQSRIMFTNRGQTIEEILHQMTMYDYKSILHKYPPIYAEDIAGMSRVNYNIRVFH